MTLPTNARERKDTPIYSGVLMYFPDAIAEVARLSQIGNDQHNPGQPLYWNRGKSGDELDALTRHLLEAGEVDEDGIPHLAKVAWRALAALQKWLEEEHCLPLPPNARDVETDADFSLRLKRERFRPPAEEAAYLESLKMDPLAEFCRPAKDERGG